MERFPEFPPSPSERHNLSPTSHNGELSLSRPMMSRAESNPHPTTTFVQADSATFKQVVQMLTGSVVHPPPPDPGWKGHSIPPVRTGQKKQGFKLYERRNSLNLKYGLAPLLPNPNSSKNIPPAPPENFSPSKLKFPTLTLMSPVTPLTAAEKLLYSPSSEEEKAIAQKGFYLHPSPRSRRENESPRLLPLFPVTSPSPSPPRESSTDPG